MPKLGEKILREAVRNEVVARRVERAVRVRDRIRELYYRENHPFVYWWRSCGPAIRSGHGARDGGLSLGELVVGVDVVRLQWYVRRTGHV